MVRQDVHHVPVVRPRPQWPRGGHGPVAVSDLTAGEGRRGRREPSGGGRLYGNMHHNSLGQRHLTDYTFVLVPVERGCFLSLSLQERSAFLCSFLSVCLSPSFFPSFLPSSRRGRSRESNNCVRKKDGGENCEKTAKSTSPTPVLGTRRVDLLLCHPPECLARSANLAERRLQSFSHV